jgi:hypothetical protein
MGGVAAVPVNAAEEPEPTTQATPVETDDAMTAASTPAATTATAPSEPPADDGDDNRGIAIAIFVLGAFVVVLAYAFYDRWRKSYQALALSALKTTGKFPDTIFNPVEQAQFAARALGEGVKPPPAQPVVSGPTAVAVDEKATYSATVDDSPADSCSWAIEPSDAATVEPAIGASVRVTANKEGPFTLSAKIGEGTPTVVHVAAVAKAAAGGVPLLGTGFAGFAAAMVAIVLAAGLTVLEVLGSEAFIAFLGPLLGYFFAQGRDTGHSASE